MSSAPFIAQSLQTCGYLPSSQMIMLTLSPFGPSLTYVLLPGYQGSIGAQGMILRYFWTICPLSFMSIIVLYGFLCGWSSWSSPVSEKMPQTLLAEQASAKTSVSGPGTVVDSSFHFFGLNPWVLYSGNKIKSRPGRPALFPETKVVIRRQFAKTSCFVPTVGTL